MTNEEVGDGRRNAGDERSDDHTNETYERVNKL